MCSDHTSWDRESKAGWDAYVEARTRFFKRLAEASEQRRLEALWDLACAANVASEEAGHAAAADLGL